MEGAVPQIALVGLGSDGSDGIEAGIHVRWDFPPKLGFPPDGVRLYRWEVTAIQVLSCFRPDHDPAGQSYPVGAAVDTSISSGTPGMVWTAASRAGTAVASLTVITLPPLPGEPIPTVPPTALALPDQANLRLDQCAADRIEITYQVRPGTDFTITAHARNFDYEAVHVDDDPSGKQDISIVGPGIVGLTFEGQGSYIARICAYCCFRGERDGWCELTEGLIYRLPVGLDGSAFEPFHIPPDLVVRRLRRVSIAARGQNLQVEHPV
jgi:hypothetical protein